jgi:hypothetical protein
MIFLPIISLGFLILFLMGALISFQYFTHYQSLTMLERTHIVDQRQRAQTALGFLVAFSFGAVIALGGLILPAIIGYSPPPMQPSTTDAVQEGTLTVISPDNSLALPTSADESPTTPAEPEEQATSAPVLPSATIGNTGGAGANIRSSPGLGGTIIETLSEGTTVFLLGELQEADDIGWQKIEIPDTRQGWVANLFLITDNE